MVKVICAHNSYNSETVIYIIVHPSAWKHSNSNVQSIAVVLTTDDRALPMDDVLLVLLRSLRNDPKSSAVDSPPKLLLQKEFKCND